MTAGTHVALLRGINVGGSHLLPMRELVELLQGIGARDVRTYIQSGNAVFRAGARDAKALGSRLAAAIDRRRGFAPTVLVLPATELRRAVAANPYPRAAATPQTLHLAFLAAQPRAPDLDALRRVAARDETFTLRGRVFYLHAPRGIGRSKLFAVLERALGVPATVRNWRTVGAILALADETAAATASPRRR